MEFIDRNPLQRMYHGKDAQRAIPAHAKSAERVLFDNCMMTQEPFSPGHHLVIVPCLGAGGKPILVVNWLLEPGANVIAGERIAELLTDSVLFQLESDVNGTLKRYLVPTGQRVSEGEAIAEIEVERAA